MQRLHDQCVVMLSQDSFYRGLTPEECKNVKGESAHDLLLAAPQPPQQQLSVCVQPTALMSQMPLTPRH